MSVAANERGHTRCAVTNVDAGTRVESLAGIDAVATLAARNGNISANRFIGFTESYLVLSRICPKPR
jgi:hypothetical protein